MANPKFDRPVSVLDGLGAPHDVRDARDAYDMLTRWQGIPDLDHSGAVAVCRKALNGERSGKDVRQAFQRFASNNSILLGGRAYTARRR
jgi:hypothetical protein